MTINKVSNVQQLVLLLISQNDQTVYHIQHTHQFKYLYNIRVYYIGKFEFLLHSSYEVLSEYLW